SAFAELCMHHEPDTAHDPLDGAATVRRVADPACRRMEHKAELLAAEKRALPRLPRPSRIPGRAELARRRVQVVSWRWPVLTVPHSSCDYVATFQAPSRAEFPFTTGVRPCSRVPSSATTPRPCPSSSTASRTPPS